MLSLILPDQMELEDITFGGLEQYYQPQRKNIISLYIDAWSIVRFNGYLKKDSQKVVWVIIH